MEPISKIEICLFQNLKRKILHVSIKEGVLQASCLRSFVLV